jgi:hypothetical protein
MRRVAKRLLFYALLIAVPLALIEIAAVAFFVVRDGGYSSAPELLAAERNQFVLDLEDSGRGCGYIDTMFPHPYLAFVHHDVPPCGIRSQLNSQGLFGRELPVERDPEFFDVLLTGGSVAAQLGQMNNPDGPRFLELALNEVYRSPTGKPFRVFNGAAGAWKYPQQLILFAMFARQLDAVVTLDGFNELLATGVGQGAPGSTRYRLEQPANNFVFVSPLTRYGLGQLSAVWLINKLRFVLAATPVLDRSHAAYAAYLAIRQGFAAALPATGGARRDRQQRMFTLPAGWDDAQAFAWNVDQYRAYIRQLHGMAAETGALSASFVQPVPALQKPLTAEEQAVVGSLDYGPDYARMAQALATLADDDLAVFSLVDLFSETNATVYSDHIHLRFDGPQNDSSGYRLMAARMARDLARAWDLRPKTETASSD